MYKTTKEIRYWLDKYGICNYTIRDSFVVDVDNDVELFNDLASWVKCETKIGLIKLPLKFGVIEGNFNISLNNLDDLYNCPDEVKGNFDCSANKLKNLIGSPKKVGGDFMVVENNLQSLTGAPIFIGGNFYLNDNLDLGSFNGIDIQMDVRGDIACDFAEEANCVFINHKDFLLHQELSSDIIFLDEENKRERAGL